MKRVWLCILLGACGGDPGAGDSAGGDGGAADGGGVDGDPLARGECPLDTRIGGFTVESNDSYALVGGLVRDAVVPADVLDLVSTEGDCTLWRRTNPFCDPACESGETCDESGACIPYPLGQDLGAVVVEGLLAAVEMSPVEPDKSYFFTALPNPPWTEGGAIRLRAEDAGIELWGVGLPGFAPAQNAWVLTEGSALALAWDAPPADVGSRVRLDLTVDQHGATPISLSCSFADDGAAELPAALVDALLGAGISGYPNGRLSRQTADRVELAAGCVDLRVLAPDVPAVSVSGHTPCTSDEDCPEGQTCDLATETCR